MRPVATYRLQFNAEFDFAAADGIADYLHQLGVSHCYASPLFQAGPSSTHGYDVCGFGKINARLGGEQAFRNFSARLKKSGLQLLLDMVPNHMGNDLTNEWWVDVLRHGRQSRYARWFDIDWDASAQVVLPVLEARYAEVLEAGQLQIVEENGLFALQYHDRKFPLNDHSTEHLRETIHWKPNAESYTQAMESRLAGLNGTPGEPDSFRHLDDIIRQQHYRLTYWRNAADQINYRRFFDVTELISVRMEDPEVFQATHELLLSLLESGDVAGLRIDHPDGLWDPRQYFERLRASGARYVVAEKILTGEERLPATWPVDGTTGYDFLQRLNSLFVQSGNEAAFDRAYAEFTGSAQAPDLHAITHECKRIVLERSFRAEVNTLTRRLMQIALRTRYGLDFTWRELHRAISDFGVGFPVYRSYINGSAEPSETDLQVIHEAAGQARAARSGEDTMAVDFLESILTLNLPADLDAPELRAQVLDFILHFQQLTGPLMAKGLEDTAFYRYNRMISLNEVGGEPGVFGISPDEFHAFNTRTLRDHPGSLLATATHDTKRGEDVRARINVLSEVPEEWAAAIGRWRHVNHGFKATSSVPGVEMPDAVDEYFLYQTLAGAWLGFPSVPDLTFTERIVACMLKSIKESKRHTSWTDPNADYEQATERFTRSILGPQAGPFLDDFRAFHRTIAFHGHLNSMSQTLLKITSPGVPDFYQGCELWDFSLVDPDNRRPVDYHLRRSLFSELRHKDQAIGRAALLRELMTNWATGEVKLFLIRQALEVRNAMSELFADGDYVPLRPKGPLAGHLCAFARIATQGRAAVVVVPRFTCTLMQRQIRMPIGPGTWAGNSIELPGNFPRAPLRNALDGRTVPFHSCIGIEDALVEFPVALLTTGWHSEN